VGKFLALGATTLGANSLSKLLTGVALVAGQSEAVILAVILGKEFGDGM
jgi:hypothetical protein